jgi:hypothetical protein
MWFRTALIVGMMIFAFLAVREIKALVNCYPDSAGICSLTKF